MIKSKLVLNKKIKWICFHGGYDFGYFLKILLSIFKLKINTKNHIINSIEVKNLKIKKKINREKETEEEEEEEEEGNEVTNTDDNEGNDESTHRNYEKTKEHLIKKLHLKGYKNLK